MRSLGVCVCLCNALLKFGNGTRASRRTSLTLAIPTWGMKHEILLQVNLEKSSQHRAISESPFGTLSAAVEFDGSLLASGNATMSLPFRKEQLREHISYANVDPNGTESKAISNSTPESSPNSGEKDLFAWSFELVGWQKLSRRQVTNVYMGCLIILGGLFVLVGNCWLQFINTKKTDSDVPLDTWKTSFSGLPQNQLAQVGTPREILESPNSPLTPDPHLSRTLAESLTPDYSKTYRVLGEDVVRDEVLCDYVFVMPLKGNSHAHFHVSGGARVIRLNWDVQVDGLACAKAVFMSANKSHLWTEQELEERFSTEMTSEEYQNTVRKLLAETFTGRHFGLMLTSDPSADHDEIFVKLSIPRHNNTIDRYAGNLSYHMPLNDASYKRINKKVKKDADLNLTRAFAEFFPEHKDSFEPFREIDYVRLLKARLDKYINLNALCSQGVVTEHFVPHNYTEVQAMCELWANVWTWYRIPTHDNDDKIRNYFGEEVAWMFVWNVHYVRWLCFPASCSALVYFRMLLPTVLQHEIAVAFAVMMALWSTLFNTFYDRREKRIMHRWGMHDYTPLATLFARNDYKKGQQESWTVLGISLLGDVLALLTVAGTVGGIVATDRWTKDSWWTHSLLMTAQILLIDIWWRNVSLLIVQWENHEHQDKWLRSWTRKMFCIRLFNNLYPFLYVGFFKEHYTEKGCKPFESCLDELSWDLLSYFAARILKEVLQNMWRLGVLRVQIISETWRGINTPVARFTHTYLELQAKALPYNDVVKMNDWIEQVLTFAFVACFSVVLPAISFVALLTSLLRTRLVAHRNALYLRRPLPRGSRGIEAWREMLVLTEVVAVVINLGFAIFVMKPLCDLPLDQKCVIFFIAEHLILAVKVTCKTKFPTVPRDVEKIDRSCKGVVRRSFIDIRRHPVDCQVVQVVDDVPNIGPNAFGGRNSSMRRESTRSNFESTRHSTLIPHIEHSVSMREDDGT